MSTPGDEHVDHHALHPADPGLAHAGENVAHVLAAGRRGEAHEPVHERLRAHRHVVGGDQDQDQGPHHAGHVQADRGDRARSASPGRRCSSRTSPGRGRPPRSARSRPRRPTRPSRSLARSPARRPRTGRSDPRTAGSADRSRARATRGRRAAPPAPRARGARGSAPGGAAAADSGIAITIVTSTASISVASWRNSRPNSSRPAASRTAR